jgi:hypothetical protein
MSDPTLEPVRDRMVRALYDELPPADRRALEEEIASDPDLRREWDELREARSLLREALEPVSENRTEPTAPPSWRRFALGAAAGFAAAACLFTVLLGSGLRIDRSDGGLLVRFGPPPQPTGMAALADAPLTRAEFEYFAASLVDATSARIDDLERRQIEARTVSTRALYDALASNQQRQYHDLVYRLESSIPVRYDPDSLWSNRPSQEGAPR